MSNPQITPDGAYRGTPDAFQVVSMTRADVNIAAAYWAKHHAAGNASMANMCAGNVTAGLETLRLYGGRDTFVAARDYVRKLARTKLAEYRATTRTV